MTMLRVKICGITNHDDARHAADAGADELGFNFFPESPRYVTQETAAAIVDEIGSRVTSVGVFVNEQIDTIRRCVETVGLDIVQLHGDESPDLAAEIGRTMQVKVIKAWRVGPDFESVTLADHPADHFLLDTFVRGSFGGSGQTFDWSKAAEVAKVSKIYLAGGLTPLNVKEAIRIVRPYAVDVASGVEERPGRKDAKKVIDFIRNAKDL